MYRVGVYCRLSKEDGDKEMSDSIGNQKSLIEDFVKKFDDMLVVGYFIDDGYSGLTFDRPDFNKMMREIVKGNINTVITKDLSRLGRDRLEVGNYTERVFPLNKVRYISILDGMDSLTGNNKDMAPFKALMNEMYAQDISRKVRGAFDAKRSKGEFIGAFAPYGYKKDEKNRNKLIIDEEAAAVVKQIFQMFIGGTSKMAIAKTLNNNGVPCPTEYKNSNGYSYINSNRLEAMRYWTYSTVAKCLANQVYAGDIVQKKHETIFKTSGKKIQTDKEKWIIIEGTHEPIIDKETFQNVQTLLAQRTRKMGLKDNITIYAGVLRCADCGRAMSKTKYKNTVYYKCGTYKNLGKNYCSGHVVREDVLDNAVIKTLRSEAEKAMNTNDVNNLIRLITDDGDSDSGKQISKAEDKLENVDRYKKKAYEDYADKLLSKTDYIKLRDSYEKEAAALQNKIAAMKAEIHNIGETKQRHNSYAQRFVQYINIDALNREIIVELVDYIRVYENRQLEIKFKFESPIISKTT